MRNKHVPQQPKNKTEKPKKGKGAYDRRKLKEDDSKSVTPSTDKKEDK